MTRHTLEHRRLTAAMASIVCVVALAGNAEGTVIAPARFADIVNGSQLIVHGRVVDVRGETTADRRSIHSLVTVAVDETLKGAAGRTVTFQVPQGQVGRYRRIIVGAPEFAAGEEVLLFLVARPPAIPTVFGLNQGVRRLRGDAAGRRLALDAYVRQVRTAVERAR